LLNDRETKLTVVQELMRHKTVRTTFLPDTTQVSEFVVFLTLAGIEVYCREGFSSNA
jgi:hypothetical protein